MYLNVNVIFIILSYHCFTVYARFSPLDFNFDPGFYGRRKDFYDCYLPMQIVDYNQPIPFTMNKTSAYPSIIHPNKRRNLYIRHKDYFNLACVGSKFITPIFILEKNTSEITVQCLNQTFLGIDGEEFEFDDFRCEKIPKSILKVTAERCQNIFHRVVEIGFQTKHFFLKLYSICFELKKKQALYSWYLAKCPQYQYRQNSKQRMNFTKSFLFDEFDPGTSYEEQSKFVGDIVNSTYLKRYNIHRIKGTRFFTPGHLTSKNAFIYTSEQKATYFYENTVPQWYIFKNDVWKNLERIIKINLSQTRNNHVIVTGTYSTCTLPDEEEVEHPLYLSMNKTINIPLYIWKMSYDLAKKTGIVYIGMNNPYKKVEKANQICDPTICPGGMLDKRFIDRQLLYCCTKDSFERIYGKIDPTIYRERDFIF